MSVAATATVVFTLSLYFTYGMMIKLPVSILPIYQIRAVISTEDVLSVPAVATDILGTGILIFLSWCNFRKCDFK